MSKITLADVAREAGLATSTVSLALNRRPSDCRLGKQTRQRALDAAAALGYRPNWRAKALAQQKTFTVAVIYARDAPYATGANEAISDALAQALSSVGYYQLLVPIVGDSSTWQDAVRPDRVDGCVVLNPKPINLGEIRQATGLPMALVNVVDDDPSLFRVIPDDRDGARRLTEHLLALGHRHIGFYVRPDEPNEHGQEHFSVAERLAGYRDAMEEAGLARQVDVVTHLEPAAYVQRMIDKPGQVTAVIAYDHFQALHLMHCVQQRGLRVPEDLSIGTFNDSRLLEYLNPALTTIALPDHDMGELAAHRLLRMLADDSAGPSEVRLPTQLRVRASTGPVPV
ncbi:MAG: LacI family DNA-binding transcriptional regulator [Planctomycetota bacterium]